MGGSGGKNNVTPMQAVSPTTEQGRMKPPPKNDKERLERAEEQLHEEKQQIDRLRKEKEEAQGSTVPAAAAKEQRLQAELLQARSTSGALRPPIEAASGRQQALNGETEAARQALLQAEQALAAEASEHQAVAARLDRTLAKRAAFKQALNELTADRGTPPTTNVAREAAEGATRALKATEDQLAKYEAELASLKAETLELMQKREADTLELRGLKEGHLVLQNAAQGMEEALAALDESNHGLQEKVFAATDRFLKKQAEGERLGQNLHRVAQELQDKQQQLALLSSMYEHEVNPVKDVLVDTTTRKRQAELLHEQRIAEIDSSSRSHAASLNIASPKPRSVSTVSLVGQIVVTNP